MAAAKRPSPPALPQGDQVFVVTGCASGIGRHIAAELVTREKYVLLTDINLKALDTLVRELKQVPGYDSSRLVHLKLDVTKPTQFDQALKLAINTWGRVDVMMNVAGYLLPGYVHEVPASEVDRHFDINTKGVVHGTQSAARVMVEAGHGHIINIASLAALAPIPGIALYSASKFAVRGFSLAAGMELARHGVKVTVVCPDAVRTPMLDLQKDYDEAAMTFSGGKLLTVDDVARVIFDRVLPKKPREVHIPYHRGLMARLGNEFPFMADLLSSTLRKQGRKKQAKYEKGS